MIVTVFRSALRPGVREEYVSEVGKLAALAQTMPGYISHKSFYSDDGERCTIVEFENEEGLQVWRTNAQHLDAKKKARKVYYTSYNIQVCELKHQAKFDRSDAEQATE